MAKDRESLTIDHDINEGIKVEAKKQRRSFSGMIEFICSEYLFFGNKLYREWTWWEKQKLLQKLQLFSKKNVCFCEHFLQFHLQ